MQIQTENMIGMDPIVCLYGVPAPEPKAKPFGIIASIGLGIAAVVIGIVVVIKKKIKRKKDKENVEK